MSDQTRMDPEMLSMVLDTINKLEKEKQRYKLAQENLCIVNIYFIDRVRAFIKIFHSKNSLEHSKYWFHIEYQGRGIAYTHSYSYSKDNPGIEVLLQKVLYNY